MAKYAALSDCVDPSVTVSARNLTDADVYIDMMLINAGLTTAEIATITLPNANLNTIAVYWAKHLACNEGIMGDSTALVDKGDRYKADANALAKQLNKTVLGIATAIDSSGNSSASGYGSITLGRG